jgi:hypothetical protein
MVSPVARTISGLHVRRRDLIGLLQLDRLEARFRRRTMRSISGNSGNRWPRLAEKRGMRLSLLAKASELCTKRRASDQQPLLPTANVGYRPITRRLGHSPRDDRPSNHLISLDPPLLPTTWWDGLWLTETAPGVRFSQGPRHDGPARTAAMNDAILQEISDFCRQAASRNRPSAAAP